jgi:hypothetical protein
MNNAFLFRVPLLVVIMVAIFSTDLSAQERAYVVDSFAFKGCFVINEFSGKWYLIKDSVEVLKNVGNIKKIENILSHQGMPVLDAYYMEWLFRRDSISWKELGLNIRAVGKINKYFRTGMKGDFNYLTSVSGYHLLKKKKDKYCYMIGIDCLVGMILLKVNWHEVSNHDWPRYRLQYFATHLKE